MTPEYFEILVVRELRKVGFDVGTVRTHRRSELPEPERGFVLELVIPLRCAGATWRALIVCLHQLGVVAPDVITSAKARLADASADVVIIFATAEFAPEALTVARERRGVAADRGRPERVRHERLEHAGSLSRLASRIPAAADRSG